MRTGRACKRSKRLPATFDLESTRVIIRSFHRFSYILSDVSVASAGHPFPSARSTDSTLPGGCRSDSRRLDYNSTTVIESRIVVLQREYRGCPGPGRRSGELRDSHWRHRSTAGSDGRVAVRSVVTQFRVSSNRSAKYRSIGTTDRIRRTRSGVRTRSPARASAGGGLPPGGCPRGVASVRRSRALRRRFRPAW